MPLDNEGAITRLVCRACRRTFSKAEHLKRHERSHTGARPFACKACKRAFARQDALARHERLIHARPNNGNSAKSPGRLASATGTIAGDVTRPRSHDTSSDQMFNGLTGGHNGHPHHDIWPEIQTPETRNPGTTTLGGGGLQNNWNGASEPAPAVDLDFSLIWPDSEHLYQSIISSSDITNQWQIPLGTLPLSPNQNQAPPPPQHPQYASTPPSNSTGGAGGGAAAFNFESPSSFDDRGCSIGAIPSGGNRQAVQDVSEMVTSSSSRVTAAVNATSITSIFLDECLHMFFARFIPTFPVLHRPTFVFRDCTHPLLLNAIAIGSLYLGPKDAVTKGETLWRLAHTAVSTSWQTLISHRGPYDQCKGVQLVLTALLSQIYGTLSKNRAIRATSQIFRAHGFHWAKRCGMFAAEPYPHERLPTCHSSAAEKEHQWRTWAAREIQHRALLAYYVLDGLAAQMSGESTSVRHTANRLRFPSSESMFEANSADEWLIYMRGQNEQSLSSFPSSFHAMFHQLFSPTEVHPSQLWLYKSWSSFSTKVILEGLQSLLSDCDCDGENEDESESSPSYTTAIGAPMKSDLRRALARIYETINRTPNMTPEERLELLLRWHAICLDTATSSAQLCDAVCATYNVTQHVVGYSTNAPSRPASSPPPLDLKKWAQTPNARRALLHSVAIQDIVEQLPRGRAHVIHMPSSLFAAATVYSVFCLAGATRINLPRTVSWKDVVLLPAAAHTASGSVPNGQGAFTEAEACLTLGELASSTTAPGTAAGNTDSGSTSENNTRQYIRGGCGPAGGSVTSGAFSTCATRNVLYELNSMQKLFRCLISQWGIAHDMESVVDRWIALCHC